MSELKIKFKIINFAGKYAVTNAETGSILYINGQLMRCKHWIELELQKETKQS